MNATRYFLRIFAMAAHIWETVAGDIMHIITSMKYETVDIDISCELNLHFDWASFLTAMTPYTFSRTPNNGSVLPWCVLKHYVLSKRDRSSFVYYSTFAVHPVLSTASRVLKKGLAARSCNNREFCRRREYLEDGLELDCKWFGMSSWMILAT